MTISFLGSLTMAQVAPFAVFAQASINASAAAALPAVQAQVTGLLAAQASISASPPSITAALSVAQQLVVGIEAAIAVGVPSVDFQASVIASALAQLQTQLAGLQAAIAFSFPNPGGIFAYSYAGSVGALGTDISGATIGGFPGGAPGDACNALLIATEIPATWAAIQTMLKTTA